MKNNIKKTLVKFREDLLYFLAFYADFCLCPKLVIITILTAKSESKKRLYNVREGSDYPDLFTLLLIQAFSNVEKPFQRQRRLGIPGCPVDIKLTCAMQSLPVR